MKQPRHRYQSFLTCACWLAALGLGACDASERQSGQELPEDGRVEDLAPAGDTGRAEVGAAAPADTVHVTLTDFAVEMPTTLPAGVIAFHVQNHGNAQHNFEVEGDDMEESLPANLNPGESDVLVLDLKPGTWKVYCPVADHEERGMRLQITVQ